MSRADPDIAAVREPTDESLARARRPVAARRRRSRSRLRAAVPAMAGALVAALAVGAVVIAERDAAPPPATNLAERLLDDLLGKAVALPPVPVRDDQFLYTREQTSGDVTFEAWREPQGNIAVATGVNGQVAAVRPDRLERERAAFRAGGPSLQWFTPEFLAGLPTEPDRLDPLLAERALTFGLAPSVTAVIADILLRADLVLTPPVRVALMRQYADHDGVRIRRIVIKGRSFVVMGRTDAAAKGSFVAVLFDPATGRVAGNYLANSAMELGPPWAGGRYWTSESAVVDRAGERP
jgi:hypothetical protein